MWNAEVNSGESGIRDGAEYEDLKDFALGFSGFPGYAGDPEEPAVLASAGGPKHETTRLQRFIGRITGEDE